MRKDKALLKLLSNPRVITELYSPRIPRTIPVSISLAWPKLLNEWLVVGFVSGILLFLIISMSLQIKDQVRELARRRTMQGAIVSEIAHWQKVTKQYTQYRDGYFRLALLQYQLGNEQLAGIYVGKSLAVDPNFQAGRAFQEKLEGE
jgi:hypothetical protein